MAQTIIFTTAHTENFIIAFLHRKIIVKVISFMACFAAHHELPKTSLAHKEREEE
jgi:hypothetical protein